MDVASFQTALLRALAGRPFVQSVDLQSEAVVVKGRVLLAKERFLQVYFNEQTGTTAYALIEDEKRLWGVDHDSLRGWHLHPMEHPDQHREVASMTPREVVEALSDVWDRLP